MPEITSCAHRVAEVIGEVEVEVAAAVAKYPPFNSAHEGYSILHEELDELWDEVKVKQAEHDFVAMRKEAIQVAAMAVRFAMDVCP